MKVISWLSQSSKIYGLSLSQCGDWTVGQSLSLMLGKCLTVCHKKRRQSMPPCRLIASDVDRQLGLAKGSKHLSESQPAGPASAISPMS